MKVLQKQVEEVFEDIFKYKNGKYFIDREISWLNFNERILHLSQRKDNPFLERLKFLAITATNLDEFIMVRLSESKNNMKKSPDKKEISGLTYSQEYNALIKLIASFKRRQIEIYGDLKNKLNEYGYSFTKMKHLNKKELFYLNKYFDDNIFPLLTPTAIDGTNHFPPIKSKEHMCYVITKDSKSKSESLSLISMDYLQRLVEIKSVDKTKRKFVLVEDLIKSNLSKLFVDKEIVFFGTFRLLREADIPVDTNTDIYFVDRMKEILEKREVSSPIHMELDANFSKYNVQMISNMFSIKQKNIFLSPSIIDLSFLMNLPFKDEALQFDKFVPKIPSILKGEKDMFSAIETNDVVLHHPYHSFLPVIDFIRHAGNDEDVVAIKQTLYRVSSIDGPIVNALCNASLKGKNVSVLLELKARFDEQQNISMINKMKRSGIKIIYGIEELKTHCKFSVVIKNKGNGIKMYSHIGTGNYNERTAKIYTDISLFTYNQDICKDLLHTFNMISGASEPSTHLENILISPTTLRRNLYRMIDREIELGKRGKIIIKLNSLSDYGIISKLYRASEAGVKINIICRGICSMRPINDNIKIKSIVGRFLEHSRIYYFHNAGKEKIFISSADMLTRNLDRRVEIMVPILEKHVKSYLKKILEYGLNDNFNSYKMNKNGSHSISKTSSNSFKKFIKDVNDDNHLVNIPVSLDD